MTLGGDPPEPWRYGHTLSQHPLPVHPPCSGGGEPRSLALALRAPATEWRRRNKHSKRWNKYRISLFFRGNWPDLFIIAHPRTNSETLNIPSDVVSGGRLWKETSCFVFPGCPVIQPGDVSTEDPSGLLASGLLTSVDFQEYHLI